MKFSCESVEKFTVRAFLYAGLSEADARQAAEVVVQADRSGVYSHGLQRLSMYLTRLVDGAVNKSPHLQLTSDVPSCLAFDGDNGLGIVNAPRVMDRVINQAKDTGIAAATLCHSNHYGAGNYYGWKAAKSGVIGICMTNTSPCMAPTGGAESMIGTNPLTVAFPARNHYPVVLDMATSVVSYGKLQVMAGSNSPIPEGWALDKNGNPTTDASEGLQGSVLPIGGYKGYGLALIIDLFSAILSGACYGREIGRLGVAGSKEPEGIGQFFMAIDISRFMPFENYLERIDRYIDMMKNTTLAPGVAKIWMPGEIEFEKAKQISQEGIDVAASTEARLMKVCKEIGFAAPEATLSQMIEAV